MSLEINLIEGERGKLHVTSDDVRTEHAVMFGTGRKVLNIDEMFEGVFVSNNTVRILSGVLYNNGMFIRIDREDYKEVNIENGIGGAYRNDLICIRYERNIQTHIESAHLVVKKGTASENTATDPTYTEGNILDFDSVDEFPLYRVRLDGIRATLEPLFEVADVMDNINLYRELQNQQQADASMQQELTAHQQNYENPHYVTKGQLGLDKVDNTADKDKPVSNLQEEYMKGIENSLRSDINDVARVTELALNKASNHIADKNNPHEVTKAQIGLDKVDNTADKDKNVKHSDTTGKLSNAVKINGVDFDGSKDITIGDSERNMITDTATGEHITATNSADASVRGLRIDGRTEQFTTTGKNLLIPNKNFQTTTTNGITLTPIYENGLIVALNVKGTATEDVNSIWFGYYNTTVGEPFIFSQNKPKVEATMYLRNLNGSSDWIAGESDLCTPTSVTETVVYAYVKKGVTIDHTFYPMIRLASIEDATYEPYTGGVPSPNPDYPQDIKGVGDSGEVEVTVTGKNVFDISKALVGKFNSDGDFEIIYGVRRFYEYNFKENTQYTFSGYVKNENTTGGVRLKIFYTDGTADNACLYHTTTEYKYITYTSAIGKTISHIESYYSSSGSMRIKNGELQIEEGTVATEYEPYKSQTVSIPLDSPLYSMDKVTLKNGKLEILRKLKLVDFPNITSLGTYSDGRKYAIFQPGDISDYGTFKCTHMKEIQPSDNVTYGFIVNQYNSVFMFSADDTIETANAKMSGAEVLYLLKEPTTEIIETDIDLSTYCNVTNITNSDNANMEVEYFVNSDNGNVVGDLQKDIDNLEKTKAGKEDISRLETSKANKTDISRLETSKANVSDLKDYVVVEKQHTIVYSETGIYNIEKSGYTPIFVKVNEAYAGTVVCTYSNIEKDDTGYYVDYFLYNMSGTGVNTEIAIEVVYIRNI